MLGGFVFLGKVDSSLCSSFMFHARSQLANNSSYWGVLMTRLQAFWRPSAAIWIGSFWSLVLLTLWLSLVPADQVPSAFHFWDKAQHSLGFAGLGFLGLMAYQGRIVVMMLYLAMFGAGIEFAQWWTGWRQGDWQDWVADCVGLMMGAVAWRLMRRASPR
jgi:VanZ family protein